MIIEIYIGIGDDSGTWFIRDVSIPNKIFYSEEKDGFIQDWINKEDIAGNIPDQVAFWGIYHEPAYEMDDEEDE
jgi:hypothetical protein